MRLEFVFSAINININKYIYFFNYSLFTENNIMNKKKLYLRQNMILAAEHVTISRLISALCTFKPFILHNRIYRNRKKILSGVLVFELWPLSTKHHLDAVFFFYILHNFQLVFYTKMWQSDCTQRHDVVVSSETFGCFTERFP